MNLISNLTKKVSRHREADFGVTEVWENVREHLKLPEDCRLVAEMDCNLKVGRKKEKIAVNGHLYICENCIGFNSPNL